MSDEKISKLEVAQARAEEQNKQMKEILTKLDSTVSTLTSAIDGAKGVVIGVLALLGIAVTVIGYFLNDKVDQFNRTNIEQNAYAQETRSMVLQLRTDVDKLNGNK